MIRYDTTMTTYDLMSILPLAEMSSPGLHLSHRSSCLISFRMCDDSFFFGMARFTSIE